MLRELVGKKIGMTQIFDKDRRVVPVTVVHFSGWYVVQLKTVEKDGYSALQLGNLKTKYKEDQFSANWISKKNNYFSLLKEILIDSESWKNFKVGQKLNLENIDFTEGDFVDVAGNSIGRGFQGVVKRWNFSGGPKSHGSNFHRVPGSIGNMCSQGNVIKGKKLPGHYGAERVKIKGLKVIRINKDSGSLYIKGAVPGKKNALLAVSKQG